jgi:SAM-dependent methyltransferase
MELREQMDAIYRTLPLDRIPWVLDGAPQLLIDLIEAQKILPCDALDIGCGSGNSAVWLAAQGFRMTGMDLSPAALALATQLAREKSADCRFVEGDVTAGAGLYDGAFDFSYDWEVLHHVFPETRELYAANLHRMLRPGAKHLSVCFSENDPDSGGSGKYRQTPLGTTLYFSSEEEIERVFATRFRILELDSARTVGKYGPHLAVMALLERD